MGRTIVHEDGGVSTTDDHVYHSQWPCVPHDPDVTCEEAQIEWARATRSGQKVARVIRAEDSQGVPDRR